MYSRHDRYGLLTCCICNFKKTHTHNTFWIHSVLIQFTTFMFFLISNTYKDNVMLFRMVRAPCGCHNLHGPLDRREKQLDGVNSSNVHTALKITYIRSTH